MKDFFKELNIIDILGIGVPGCLLVLLLGGDQTGNLLWMSQFNNNTLAFAVALIVAGSLAGMLLQELGDLIEKGLWMFESLDPRIYAAHAVNKEDLDMDDLKKHVYPSCANNTTDLIKKLCAVAAIVTVVCASALIPCAMWKSAEVTIGNAHVHIPAWFGILPLLIGGIAAHFFKPGLPENTTAQWNDLVTIRNANPYIQSRLVRRGNTSKRNLFDGWRFVMRNLVLVLAITNLVSLWKPLDLYRMVAKTMVGTGGDMTGNLFLFTFFASCVIVLMLVRYYHYAFLRYKYSLENFMRLDDEKAESKPKEHAK